MSGKNIATNLELRIKGWRAALRSRNTPDWLRPVLRANIRRVTGILVHGPIDLAVLKRKKTISWIHWKKCSGATPVHSRVPDSAHLRH